MPRRLIPLFLAISSAAFAQFGGVVLGGGGMRIPGTTYPGGQYPGNGTCPGGQYPTNGSCPGGQYPNNGPMPGMSQAFTGNLRQINPGSIAMETDDSRIIQIQLNRNTALYSTFGRARITDFDPGDYVNVSAIQDVNGYSYIANTVTLNRKGTLAERSAASQPLNVSMHGNNNGNPQTGSSQDDSDSNRPVLHRSDSGNSSSASSSGSNSSNASGSSDSSSQAASGSTSSRPRMVSQGDDGAPPAQIAPIDDPGPPVLRRGAAPRDQNVPETTSDSTPPSRPTVRAQESNGVTQVPASPPQTVEEARNMAPDRLPQPSGRYATDDPVIDQAREAAFAFTETLPDYIVKQYTTRYQSDSARRGGTQWQALDIVTADVVAEGGKESYKNVLVNGKPAKNVEDTGSWSEGEFASTLQALLSPASDGLFTNKRATTIVNRPAYRYDYTIEQPRSSWLVEAGGSRYRPAYGGAIWIDKETSRVLRIEMSARTIPAEFPLDQVESTVDYDFVLIGAKKFLLPVHSEALSCERGTSQCSRNVIDFRNYKKYGSDSSISFDETAK